MVGIEAVTSAAAAASRKSLKSHFDFDGVEQECESRHLSFHSGTEKGVFRIFEQISVRGKILNLQNPPSIGFLYRVKDLKGNDDDGDDDCVRWYWFNTQLTTIFFRKNIPVPFDQCQHFH